MSDVIDLAHAKAERDKLKPPIVSKKRDYRKCRHYGKGVVVDAQMREVRCKGCDVALDPIFALVLLCRSGDDFVSVAIELERKTEALNKLLAEEKRVKARLRRARANLEKLEGST